MDFWHASPSFYTYKDVLNFPGGVSVLVEDIWAYDARKVAHAVYSGYEVLVVWESEFNNDYEGLVKKCVTFLTQ